MKEALHRPIVLVLNRNWQAVNVRTPIHAFCQMITGTACGLNVVTEEEMYPVPWREWAELPIREKDLAVQTVRGPIRIPTIVVLKHYARVPVRRPKLCPRAIRERDGNRCQYTGTLLKIDEGSVDHVVPRSRGGRDTWENCVWASKKINSRKGNQLPQEAGLKLLKMPRALREMPVTAFIRNTFNIEDWKPFIYS